MTFVEYNSNPLYYAKKLYINGILATDITIPNGVTKIGNYTFYNCYTGNLYRSGVYNLHLHRLRFLLQYDHESGAGAQSYLQNRFHRKLHQRRSDCLFLHQV